MFSETSGLGGRRRPWFDELTAGGEVPWSEADEAEAGAQLVLLMHEAQKARESQDDEKRAASVFAVGLSPTRAK